MEEGRAEVVEWNDDREGGRIINIEEGRPAKCTDKEDEDDIEDNTRHTRRYTKDQN